MKKALLFIVLFLAQINTFAEDIQVAMLEPLATTENVKMIEKQMIRGEMVKAIASQSGYAAFSRTDIDQIMQEHNFQQSGMVDDSTRAKLGAMHGVDFVCIMKITKEENYYYLEANLVNIETGKISNPATQYGELQNGSLGNLFSACKALAGELVGHQNQSTYRPYTPSYSSSSSSSYPSYSSSSSQTGYASQPTPAVNQDFTETAWGINMKMIWVEGGDFLMGCTSEQSDCKSDEQNVRRVTVDGFYIGMLEVTQSQWEKVVGTSIFQQLSKADSDFSLKGVGPDYPMYYVSWDEAMEFCRLLSNKTGRTYTLPTEAQWEYAARGGNKNEGAEYAGSNMIDAVAWYTGNSGNSTHIVGSKRANALGIYDMSGNVWEWCKDWYAKSYVSYDTNNPVGPSSGSYRVNRGGCCSNSAFYCRVAYRNFSLPGYRFYGLGFRVVCLP